MLNSKLTKLLVTGAAAAVLSLSTPATVFAAEMTASEIRRAVSGKTFKTSGRGYRYRGIAKFRANGTFTFTIKHKGIRASGKWGTKKGKFCYEQKRSTWLSAVSYKCRKFRKLGGHYWHGNARWEPQ